MKMGGEYANRRPYCRLLNLPIYLAVTYHVFTNERVAFQSGGKQKHV